HLAVRGVHAGGSDAEMAAACRAIQSDSALRPDLARRDVERKRDRDVMAEFPRAFGVHRHPRFVQYLAIQKTTQLSPAQEIVCKPPDLCGARLQPCREVRRIKAALVDAEN